MADIDECLAASCPDKCINTDGGYKCVCPEGYTQAENGRDCTGEWTLANEPKL